MAEAEDLLRRLRAGTVLLNASPFPGIERWEPDETATDMLLDEAASEIERLTTRLDAVEKALGEAVTVASLLYQNSELCARNHHWTTGGFTMPGWLADAAGTIDRAREALPQGEGK